MRVHNNQCGVVSVLILLILLLISIPLTGLTCATRWAVFQADRMDHKVTAEHEKTEQLRSELEALRDDSAAESEHGDQAEPVVTAIFAVAIVGLIVLAIAFAGRQPPGASWGGMDVRG